MLENVLMLNEFAEKIIEKDWEYSKSDVENRLYGVFNYEGFVRVLTLYALIRMILILIRSPANSKLPQAVRQALLRELEVMNQRSIDTALAPLVANHVIALPRQPVANSLVV